MIVRILNILPASVALSATAMPVFPELGSTNVVLGCTSPLSTASCIIDFPILSLLDPLGFKNSHFASKIMYYVILVWVDILDRE